MILFFLLLESMNPSQIRVLEPFVIIIAKKALGSYSHFLLGSLSPAARQVTEEWLRRVFLLNYTCVASCPSNQSAVVWSLKALPAHPTTMQIKVPAMEACSFLRSLDTKLHGKENVPGCCFCSGLKWCTLWQGTSGDSSHCTQSGTPRLLMAQISEPLLSLYLEMSWTFLFLLPCLRASHPPPLPAAARQCSHNPVISSTAGHLLGCWATV